jgi:hypothetical protein
LLATAALDSLRAAHPAGPRMGFSERPNKLPYREKLFDILEILGIAMMDYQISAN